MKAVVCNGAGDVDVLTWTAVDDPVAGPSEVLVDVVASAVNRADLMQRQGFYPPPPGVTDVLGLECSGRISGLGEGVTESAIGDEVCCLLAGGGQAEQAAVPVGQVMAVPAGVDLVTAAGLAEVGCTVWSNVVQIGRVSAGDVLLVHGGSSGIGTTACSAWPPPASRQQTSSPTDQSVTPSPSPLIRPLHSSPRTSVTPGGGG
jgi:NADPH:quinone reductase-like Zn-dependent oxidoreductase